MMNNNTYFDNLSIEEKETAIKKALSQMNKYYWDKIEDGYYLKTCYLDYRDYLDDNNVDEIIKSVQPSISACRDVLSDKMFEWYEDSIHYDWNEIINEIISILADEFDQDEDEFDNNEIKEIAEDYVCVEPPIDEIMNKSEVKVVIALENGNEQFDNFDTYIESDENIVEKYKGTSVEWLVKQQGYTMQQLKQEWEDGNTNSKFLKSLVTEIREVYDWSGLALTFLTKLSVSELFNDIYGNSIGNKVRYKLTISKDAMCGFLDGWYNGVCGYFIELEKDVVIPSDMLSVDSVYPDASYKYGPDNICGFSNEAWQGEVAIG